MYNAIEVLASGLSATRLRVNTIASNIANAETTRTPEGGPYRRRDVVQIAKDVRSTFSSTLDRMSLAKPQVMGVVEDTTAPRVVHNPSHPDADELGNVEYPNINVVTTMTDLMSASRLYQANVAALEAARQMGRDATNISIRF